MKWKEVLHDPSPWITALATGITAVATVAMANLHRGADARVPAEDSCAAPAGCPYRVEGHSCR
jgi:hypothetical protein